MAETCAVALFPPLVILGHPAGRPPRPCLPRSRDPRRCAGLNHAWRECQPLCVGVDRHRPRPAFARHFHPPAGAPALPLPRRRACRTPAAGGGGVASLRRAFLSPRGRRCRDVSHPVLGHRRRSPFPFPLPTFRRCSFSRDLLGGDAGRGGCHILAPPPPPPPHFPTYAVVPAVAVGVVSRLLRLRCRTPCARPSLAPRFTLSFFYRCPCRFHWCRGVTVAVAVRRWVRTATRVVAGSWTLGEVGATRRDRALQL